jgi:hypothetical protein
MSIAFLLNAVEDALSTHSLAQSCQSQGFHRFTQISAMQKAKVLVFVGLIVAFVALATPKAPTAPMAPTFSGPNAVPKAQLRQLPKWEHFDAKLQALAAEKNIARKETLRDFLMGEVPKIVTYEVYPVDGGFVSDVQVGDHLHFKGAHTAANEDEAKRSAAVAALWELQWEPVTKPSAKSLRGNQKQLRGHFEFAAPHTQVKKVMNEDMLRLLKKTHAKIKLLGWDEKDNDQDLFLYISGREDRFMKVVYKVNAMLNNMPKRLRPKAALHMDS